MLNIKMQMRSLNFIYRAFCFVIRVTVLQFYQQEANLMQTHLIRQGSIIHPDATNRMHLHPAQAPVQMVSHPRQGF